MKTITIELKDHGGFELKGLEDIESRSECIDKSKDKIRPLTEKEHENLGIGNPVLPTYLSIELPKNVPSNTKPIVILPSIGCESVTVKATQYQTGGYTEFEGTLDPNQSHIINLNTGVEQYGQNGNDYSY